MTGLRLAGWERHDPAEVRSDLSLCLVLLIEVVVVPHDLPGSLLSLLPDVVKTVVAPPPQPGLDDGDGAPHTVPPLPHLSGAIALFPQAKVGVVLRDVDQHLLQLLLPPCGAAGGGLQPGGLDSHQVGVLPDLEVGGVSGGSQCVVWHPVIVNTLNMVK